MIEKTNYNQNKTTNNNKKRMFIKQNLIILLIGITLGAIITSAIIKTTNKNSPTPDIITQQKNATNQEKKPKNDSSHAPTIYTPTPNTQTKLPPNWRKETINIKNNKIWLALPENITMEHQTDYTSTITVWFGEINKSNALIISTGTAPEVVPGWSGLPAGELKDVPDIEFMGEKIPKSKLVYEGKTTKIFYGDNTINKKNLYFRISMNWFSLQTEGILPAEEALADKIVKLITKQEENQQPDDQDMKELLHPKR